MSQDHVIKYLFFLFFLIVTDRRSMIACLLIFFIIYHKEEDIILICVYYKKNTYIFLFINLLVYFLYNIEQYIEQFFKYQFVQTKVPTNFIHDYAIILIYLEIFISSTISSLMIAISVIVHQYICPNNLNY
jgi:hypothetical protein